MFPVFGGQSGPSHSGEFSPHVDGYAPGQAVVEQFDMPVEQML
jgi:hypothetical protein